MTELDEILDKVFIYGVGTQAEDIKDSEKAYYNLKNHALKQAKQALYTDLLELIPDSLEYPPKKNDIAQTYAASGYNQALDDLRTKLKEYFGVK